MADYWKSQAKKFCEFCKCWIADNKPSIEFHEKGKRHKENVTKRLSEIGKKSRSEHEKNIKIDKEMQKMEEAALKAYMKDIEAGADFTSQLIKEKHAQAQLQGATDNSTEGAVKSEGGVKSEDVVKSEGAVNSEGGVKSEADEIIKLWYEAQSDEGHVYYWHVETGESRWEPPEEGFMSLSEQKKVQKKELKKKKEDERKRQVEEARVKEEERARLEREKMRSRRVKEEDTQPEETALAVLGPAPRVDPYGSWKPVEIRKLEPVDLQLPEQEYIQIKVPAVVEPKVKFKEKMLASLLNDEEGEVETGFKKRRLNCNPKRSMRQRLDQDD